MSVTDSQRDTLLTCRAKLQCGQKPIVRLNCVCHWLCQVRL